MNDLKVLKTLEKYRTETKDPDLQCALSVVLDWRHLAAYYKSEAGSLRIETQRLRDKIDQLETTLVDIRDRCSVTGE